MYDWKDDVQEAKEKIESAIPCIESAMARENLGYEESKALGDILLHIQDSVSLTTQLL